MMNTSPLPAINDYHKEFCLLWHWLSLQISDVKTSVEIFNEQNGEEELTWPHEESVFHSADITITGDFVIGKSACPIAECPINESPLSSKLPVTSIDSFIFRMHDLCHSIIAAATIPIPELQTRDEREALVLIELSCFFLGFTLARKYFQVENITALGAKVMVEIFNGIIDIKPENAGKDYTIDAISDAGSLASKIYTYINTLVRQRMC